MAHTDGVFASEAAAKLNQSLRDLRDQLIPEGSVVVNRARFERLLIAANALRVANADGPHPYDLRTDTVLSYGQRTAIAEVIAAADAFDQLT